MIGGLTFNKLSGRNPFETLVSLVGTPLLSTAATGETLLYTFSLPAGFMGPQDQLYIECGCTVPGDTNAKNLILRIGAVGAGLGGVNVGAFSCSLAANTSLSAFKNMKNAGVLNSQISNLGAMGGATTDAVDFSLARDICISGYVSAGAAMALKSYVHIGVQRGGQ